MAKYKVILEKIEGAGWDYLVTLPSGATLCSGYDATKAQARKTATAHANDELAKRAKFAAQAESVSSFTV